MIEAIQSMLQNCLSLDFGILDFIQQHLASPIMDRIMTIVTLFGEEGYFWILLALIFLCFRKTRKMGWSMAIALIMGLLVCNVWLKPAVARCRPFLDEMTSHGGTVGKLMASIGKIFGGSGEVKTTTVAGWFGQYAHPEYVKELAAKMSADAHYWKVDLGFISFPLKAVDDFCFPSGHTIASFEACTAMMVRDKRWGIPAAILAVGIGFSRMYLYVHYPTDVLVAVVLGILFGIIACLLINLIWHFLPSRDGLSAKHAKGGRFLAK